MTVKGNLSVAKEICQRLRDVHIEIEPFVASTVTAYDSTLKGIDFQCKDLKAIKQTFDKATDSLGRQAFYFNGQYSSGKILKELIRNMPDLIDVSFAATDGYGYREIRDMPLLPSLSGFMPPKSSGVFNSRFGFDDERSLHFEVSSLHAALGEKVCNIHIDQMGFVVRGPSSVFLNPDFPQHLVSELGLQTMLAPYLGQGITRILKFTNLLRADKSSKDIENWVARNISLELPSSKNSYRPGVALRVKATPRLTVSTKFTAKCNFCREREEDFGIPIPDGWSVGVGIQYKFGK
jgi:hypothetical protein